MTQRRLISLLLLLGLILGQAFSLAHGIEHAVSNQDHQLCATCLSSPHKYAFLPCATLSGSANRYIAPGFAPSTDSLYPCRCGYSSRAPPPTLS